jgi:DNA polymerase-3 subunit alpha
MNIDVRPPDVQISLRAFTPSGDAIVYGLGGVKNVGDEAIHEIIRSREEEGPFKSLLDLCTRVNLRKVTKRVLESLIKGGACDCFGVSRAGMLASLDTVVARAQKKQKEKNSAQISLLSFSPALEVAPVPGIGFPCEEQDTPEWDDDQKLTFEKDSLGFYLTSHPLQPFRRDMQRLGLMTLEEISELGKGQVKTGVLVTGLKEFITKKGDKMAFVQIEDLTGHAEVTIFPKTYTAIYEALHAERPLIELTGTIDANDDDYDDEDAENASKEIKLLCDSARPLLEACMSSDHPVLIPYPVDCTTDADIEEFKAILEKHKGTSTVQIQFELSGHSCIMELGHQWRVQASPQLNKDMEAWAKARLALRQQ